jgi:hypothetical protein
LLLCLMLFRFLLQLPFNTYRPLVCDFCEPLFFL